MIAVETLDGDAETLIDDTFHTDSGAFSRREHFFVSGFVYHYFARLFTYIPLFRALFDCFALSL